MDLNNVPILLQSHNIEALILFESGVLSISKEYPHQLPKLENIITEDVELIVSRDGSARL
jgi:accessory colonization factor AcfC